MTSDFLPPQPIVYGAGWCPDVRRSRALLDTEGITYRYLDVDTDPGAADEVRRLQDGQRRIPTIVWPDGSYVVEPADPELRAQLAQQSGIRRGDG